MKDFELLEKRAQELIDECPDPLEVAMTAVRAIDSYATQAVVMTRLLMAHPELRDEVNALRAEVARARPTWEGVRAASGDPQR